MQKLLLLAVCANLSLDAAYASSADLVRAKTKVPRSEYSGRDFAEMGKVLTKHLRATIGRVNECNDFTISDLQSLQARLFEVAEPELVRVYAETNDNRRERFASLGELTAHWSKLTSDAPPEAVLMLRDALCHETVMRFAHHTTETVKATLRKDASFTMPTLPTTEHHHQNGRIELQAAHREYVFATGCQLCHSRLVPLPSTEPSASCKAQLRSQCGSYGHLGKQSCTACVQKSRAGLSSCSNKDEEAWCDHAAACGGSDDCPVWPTEFSAPFTLYSASPNISAAKSNFYYKYTETEQVQTVDYYEKCFPFVNTATQKHNIPCKLFFNPSGIYLSQPGRVDCCQFVAGVGAAPPQFLQSYNLSAKGVEEPDMYGNQIKCNQWDGINGFQYWTSAAGHDVVFKDDGTGVTWRWGNFTVEPQDEKHFQLPAGSCDVGCAKFLSKEEMVALHGDPRIRHATSAKAGAHVQGVLLPTLV